MLIEHHYPTPLGDMVALFTPQGLALLEFSENTKRLDREWRDVERYAGAAAELGADARTQALGAEIDAYFTGQLQDFDTQLDLVGTPFQKSVWQALLAIPYGQTRSYGQQAHQINHPQPHAPWPPPTARTRSPSSCRATASSAATGA